MQKNKIVFMGIGNTLKGDDGVGPYIACKLEKLAQSYQLPESIHFIDCGTVPENFIRTIINFKPDKIILIDAVDFNGYPGEIRFFENIETCNISFSTHSLPPELFINCIKNEINTDVVLYGIQPKKMDFCEDLSTEIRKSADTLMEELCTRYLQ